MQLVEVRPLKPFVGSYRCSIEITDYIDDGLAEKDGQVVKVKEPRKRFVGMIAEDRALATSEIEAAIRATLTRLGSSSTPRRLKCCGKRGSSGGSIRRSGLECGRRSAPSQCRPTSPTAS